MIFIRDRNCVTLAMQDYYKQLGKLTDNLYEAKVLVTWTDIPETERKQIEIAKEMGIKTVVIQHGRNATVDYDPEYKDLNGSNKGEPKKFIGDKFLVWGEPDKERLLRGGVDKEKIVVVGCPLIPCGIPSITEKKFIVFLSHHDLRPDYGLINKEVHDILAKEFKTDYILVYSSSYLNEPLTQKIKDVPFGACRIDGEHRAAWVNMMSVLRKTKCVVSIMASSFEGLTMCFKDIPIVRVAVDLGVRDKKGEIDFEAKGVELCDTRNLIDTVKKIEPNKHREERIKIAQAEYGLDLLPAFSRMTEEINKWL